MLISYNWLKNLVPLKEPVETIVSRLIHAGVEVAQVRHLGRDITKVVVAELLSVEKHPQADRLSLTKVSTGKETFQVVCGAKNIAPGQRVPLALVGAVLPGNFEIKAAKIRGVESFGMLCSAKELGLAEDAEGILILPPGTPLGVNFLEQAGLPDTLFELEITPNRADLLSHLGVAREVGALFNKKVQEPKAGKPRESSHPLSQLVKVSVEAKALCPHYSCRVIEGVQVGPSPKWLSQTLEKLGHRSINNIVDVTNYVLLERGQPLHAFDLAQVRGSRVIARKASKGERIPLLDNTDKPLKEDMLVIADAERPIALAGVMGGSNSQVTQATQNILLEAALFLPGSVRRTARQLGLSTDSSYRFERGVDPLGVLPALDRAASLILEVAGGKLAKGVGSVSTAGFKTAKVQFRPARANAILGLDLPAKAQIGVLKGLGCKVKGSPAAKSLSVEAPSYRLDLTREIDLIEEVVRLTGYDKVPLAAPRISSALSDIEKRVPFEKEIREGLHQAGFSEAVNSTFLPLDFPDKLRLGADHPLRHSQAVLNPIADDQRVLRPSLLPGLLTNVQLNLSHQLGSVGLYELNKVFFPEKGQVSERFQAAAVLAGVPAGTSWLQPERKTDFYDIKGLAEDLLEQCRVKGAQWEFGCPAPYNGPQSFQVKDPKGSLLLWGGALSPKALKGYDISVPCFALELELSALAGASLHSRSFTPLPKFPQALRDIALVVPDGVTSTEVLAAIRELGGPDLKKASLFDLYRGTNLAPGFRSLAYRLQFQNDERTMTDQEVADKVAKIVDHLKTRYAIALR